jgi:hypothetical protein
MCNNNNNNTSGVRYDIAGDDNEKNHTRWDKKIENRLNQEKKKKK